MLGFVGGGGGEGGGGGGGGLVGAWGGVQEVEKEIEDQADSRGTFVHQRGRSWEPPGHLVQVITSVPANPCYTPLFPGQGTTQNVHGGLQNPDLTTTGHGAYPSVIFKL